MYARIFRFLGDIGEFRGLSDRRADPPLKQVAVMGALRYPLRDRDNEAQSGSGRISVYPVCRSQYTPIGQAEIAFLLKKRGNGLAAAKRVLPAN